MSDFLEAIQHLARKGLMPTSLDSAGIRAINAGIRRQSVFSAETLMVDYLAKIKEVVGSLVEPKQELRTDPDTGETKSVTVGHNPATARATLRQTLADLGYRPADEIAGTIKDLSSDERIKLVVKTNAELAQGAGNFIAGSDPDVIDAWPAQELYRQESREQPRNWDGTNPDGDKKLTGFGSRWMMAAQAAGDAAAARVLEESGRMVALKSSEIWQALGDSDDGLGNPYPPFAFNSGMWVRDVARKQAIELGLIGADETAGRPAFDFESLFQPPQA